MNIHNGKPQQRIEKTQRAATRSAATHSAATHSAATHSAAVAGDSNAQQCTATHRAAQRSVCANGPLESKTLILDQACQDNARKHCSPRN